MNILKKLRAIFFGEEEEKVIPKQDLGFGFCYWCEEPFQKEEFQKKFNKQFFHRRCYKKMIQIGRKELFG